jgi:hypothetical protein
MRSNLVDISRQLFAVTRDDVLELLRLCERAENRYIKQICQKACAAVFQKAKLPSWDQTRAIFLREDLMKQFFYFTTLLDDEYKDLKNITKNNRLCKYMGIPCLYDRQAIRKAMQGEDCSEDEEPNPIENSLDGKPLHPVAVLLLSWFALFRDYFAHWNFQRGEILLAMAEQECSGVSV